MACASLFEGVQVMIIIFLEMKKMKPRHLMIILLLFPMLISAREVLTGINPGRIFLVDKTGAIFSDYSENAIAKYSAEGKYLFDIGRKGEGPGDIKRLGWFVINPIDEVIYTTEFVNGNKWISKFSKEGKYLGDWKCQLDWLKYHGLSKIYCDTKGNFFIQTAKSLPRRHKEFTIGEDENQILMFDFNGKELKKLYTFRTDFYAEKSGKGNVTIPFHDSFSWIVYNDLFIVRENSTDHIKLFDHQGNLKKSITLPFKREKVTAKDLDTWEKRLMDIRWIRNGIAEGWFDLKYWRKRLPFPEFKPVSGGGFFVDSKGNLYSGKYPGYLPDENVWAKINLNSFEVSIVTFESGQHLMGIWQDVFYFWKRDDDDNVSITKLTEEEARKK